MGSSYPENRPGSARVKRWRAISQKRTHPNQRFRPCARGVVRGGPHPPSIVTVGLMGWYRPRVLLQLKSDRLYWPKALDALDRLTRVEDQRLRSWSEQLRQAWTKATERNGPEERAYRLGYQVGDDDEGEQGHFTDIDLAYAWLYQDVAHGDAMSTGHFDLTERYKAAVARTSAT
jgi:hypothetical protein